MANTTSSMDWNFFLSLRTIFARSRACCSHLARLLASVIDSKSSTWATPTILLSCKRFKSTCCIQFNKFLETGRFNFTKNKMGQSGYEIAVSHYKTSYNQFSSRSCITKTNYDGFIPSKDHMIQMIYAHFPSQKLIDIKLCLPNLRCPPCLDFLNSLRS